MSLALVAPLAPAALQPQQHAPVLQQLAVLERDLARADLMDVDDLMDIHDRSVVLGAYCREANLSFDVAFDATVARLRCERRVGQVLAELKPDGSRYVRRGSLKQYGVSGSQASRWRQIAALPDEEFTARLEAARLARRDISTAVLVRAARRYIQPAHHGGRPKLSTTTKLRRVLAYVREIKVLQSPHEQALVRAILEVTAAWQAALARPDVLARRASCLLCARDRPAVSAPARCSCGGKWVVS